MSIARCLVALLGVVSIVGCARMGTGATRTSAAPLPATAEEELALLRLAEHVDAAAALHPVTDPRAFSAARDR